MGSFPEPPRRDRVRSIFSGRHPWKLELGRRTLLMGVLNLTPDSFYTASRCAGTDEALESAIRLQDAGADIVDVGGESTRPGSGGVSEEEETARVIPVIERLSRALSVPISVDTSKAGVARRALAAGAWMINDVSALTADPEMAEVAAGGGGPVVLMHMRGTPETMQAAPSYGDVVAEVGEFLSAAAAGARKAGIAREMIVIDPGIGFGKTTEHNLELLARLPELAALGYPVLVGPSRKSFIGKILGVEPPERLWGTAGAAAAAAMLGADIVRVHDPAEIGQVLAVVDRIREKMS